MNQVLARYKKLQNVGRGWLHWINTFQKRRHWHSPLRSAQFARIFHALELATGLSAEICGIASR